MSGEQTQEEQSAGCCAWESVFSMKTGLEAARVLAFPRSPGGCWPCHPRASSRVSGHVTHFIMSVLIRMS